MWVSGEGKVKKLNWRQKNRKCNQKSPVCSQLVHYHTLEFGFLLVRQI